MRNVKEIYYNCMSLVNEAGITDVGFIQSVTVNNRLKKTWGRTSTRGDGVYQIEIAGLLMGDDVPMETVNNTMIHELLHTCKGCMNHGPEWKRRAEIVKAKLGYDIQRCVGVEENKRMSDKLIQQAKYAFRCKGCGVVVTKDRMSGFVKHPSWYRCAKCGGSFEEVKK